MVLILVGLGIYGDENRDRIIKLIKECDVVYLESYTSPIMNYPEFLEAAGDKLRTVSRRDLEEYSDNIVREAVNRRVVVITPGNPLIATTHVQLIIEARRLGVDVEVIHGTSAICAAIAESGLQIYKLGGVATIMRKEKSPSNRAYLVVRDNLQRGLHTLLLLEYDVSENYRMSPKEAIRILVSYDDEGVLSESTKLVVICNLGSKDKRICVCNIGDVLRGRVAFSSNDVCVVIIPGDLHFVEEEYLSLLPRCGS